MVSVKDKKKSQEYETEWPTYKIPIHFFSLECPAWTLKKKKKGKSGILSEFQLVIRVGFKLAASTEIASQVQSSLFPACEMLPATLLDDSVV